jgi:hypothetical protein
MLRCKGGRETKSQGARVERSREDSRSANTDCGCTRFGRVDPGTEEALGGGIQGIGCGRGKNI